MPRDHEYTVDTVRREAILRHENEVLAAGGRLPRSIRPQDAYYNDARYALSTCQPRLVGAYELRPLLLPLGHLSVQVLAVETF